MANKFKDSQSKGVLKGTVFDYVPDALQVGTYLKKMFGHDDRRKTGLTTKTTNNKKIGPK